MFKIETHDNSKEYFKSIVIENDSIYVTPNISLAFVLKEHSLVDRQYTWNIVDIETLVNNVYKDWGDLLNQIKLKTEVRIIISDLKKNLSDRDILKELIYLEDNISVLMSDINYLAETNLTSFNYRTENITKKTVKLIYKKLIDTEVYKSISQEILNPILAASFYKNIKDYNGGNIKKLYFYNINNLDLKRWLIIELLNQAGFEIIFKIPYFHGLKVINKSWDMVYGNTDIFDWSKAIKSSSKSYTNSKYINYLEGYNNKITKDEKVVTKTYGEISDFRKKLRDKRIITFYKDSIGPCKDIFTKEKNEKLENIENIENVEHCYQTAIGRFLLHLYNVRIKDNQVLMDFNLYRELITSGWIDIKGWNGSRLSEYLSKNGDYFSSITNIDEILQRLNVLKDLEEVNEVFEEQVKNQIKKDNKKKVLANPLRVFGYNNLEYYGVTATYMINLTIRLKNFILKAFESEGGLINVSNHFDLLKMLFKNQCIAEKSKSGSEIEKLVIRKIWGILNNSKDFSDIMHLDDIAELFNILLKVKSKESDKEDSDFSIDHLEGFIHRDRLINYNGKKIVYISDLSYKAYDKYLKNKYIKGKILTEDDFEDIFKESFNGKHREIVLKAFNLKKISIDSTEAYLKFIFGNLFINFDGVKEISWISSLRDNDNQSIILKQIESIYDNKEESEQTLDFNDIAKEDSITIESTYLYDKKELCKNNTKYSEVSYRDLDFCNDKFLYSSILSPYPMYYNDFHNKLAFSSLVSVLKNSINESYSSITKFIFPLFPQWEDVVKHNILTCEYGRKSMRDYKYFDGINYPKTIDSLYLLKSKYAVGENWKIKNRYNKGNFKQEEYYNSFINDYLKGDNYNSGIHCMMCPHIYLCRKGEFTVDNK